MAPSVAPFIQLPLDVLLDELGVHIAPTDVDFVILNNATSPQARALAWLQDDLITRTPGRSTSSVLERYALAVLYYSTSGESSWTFPVHEQRRCLHLEYGRRAEKRSVLWRGSSDCDRLGVQFLGYAR